MVDPTDFGYGNFKFSWGDHICAIFDSHAQQMEVMGAFISTGIRAEQRCVWVAPRDSGDALRDSLACIGGDLPTLEASSQLLIISEVDFYLHGGVFEPERTLRLLSTLLEDNQREGYSTMRIGNDISWLKEGRIDAKVWEAFESRLTREIVGLPLVMVCQYDRRQVSGSLIVAALRTHPAVILGDTFSENPFYVPASAQPPGAPEII